MTSEGGDEGKEFVDEMEDDRKESSGAPQLFPGESNEEAPDSLELTPLLVLLVLLLLLLRSAIGEVDDNSPRLSIISDEVTLSSFPSPSAAAAPVSVVVVVVVAIATPPPLTPPPGNQLGKLLFSVSIRS